jgi:hypothetical protein
MPPVSPDTNGQYTPRSIPGQFIKDRINEWHKHNPVTDLFMTVTADSNWLEIQAELLPGQTAADRPDLVSRVFYTLSYTAYFCLLTIVLLICCLVVISRTLVSILPIA